MEGKGIDLIDKRTMQLVGNISCQIPWYAYITEHDGKIYHTNHRTNAVTCRTINGQIMWEFSNQTCLNEPGGIAVDSFGNIYVVGDNPVSLVVISPNGKQYRQLLGKQKSLNKPTGLSFNKSTNQLLVANLDGHACLFDVEYNA